MSKTKKGFTIVEAVCSLTIFSILFITALSIELVTSKVYKSNKEVNNYCIFIEALRNDILCNMSFDQICKLDTEGRYFIEGDNLNIYSLKSYGADALFKAEMPIKGPYISLKIEKDIILHITINLKTKIKGSEEVIKCEFAKGNY